MRRKYKAIDVNELFDADDMDRTTIKGEMRKLYPAIHQKLSAGGWSAKDMVGWLGEHGMDMSVELFRVYLNDLDHEQGYSRSAKKFTKGTEAHKDHEKANTSVEHAPAGGDAKISTVHKNKGRNHEKKPSAEELKKLARSDIDLSEYE